MKTEKKTVKAGAGKGHYDATPLTFTVDGVEHSYAGRGRHSIQLSTLIVREGKSPVKQNDGTWTWREATADELAAAQKLVDSATAKETAKAESAEARAEARAARAQARAEAKAEKAEAKKAAKEAKAAKAAARAQAKADKAAARKVAKQVPVTAAADTATA